MAPFFLIIEGSLHPLCFPATQSVLGDRDSGAFSKTLWVHCSQSPMVSLQLVSHLLIDRLKRDLGMVGAAATAWDQGHGGAPSSPGLRLPPEVGGQHHLVAPPSGKVLCSKSVHQTLF